MNVAVCVKVVPAPDAPAQLSPQTHNLERGDDSVLDEADSFGVEIALRLAEQAGGGEVVLLSMAPHTATSGLRTALAMGAARALLVSDERLAGSDALGTARVLAALARRAGADLLVAATESSDGYTGTVPAQVAELLGQPAVTYAKHAETDGSSLTVQRQTDKGYEEVLCPLPAVLSVTAGVVDVRYPSLKGILSAKNKPVEVLSLADIAIDPSLVGAAGARQEVISVEPAEQRRGGQVMTDEGGAESKVIEVLTEWGVLS
ncbi:MAG TPA: electron transfer flavoprotein subunit beta/FixA family protein [Acidimicrobiales bacterium]|nr:electron transfer flavoprotein subunit beta/FixA family protein [Acidimicrobiales bacterium]